MSCKPQSKKLRRFFTEQSLKDFEGGLWLNLSETHHLRDSIRLKPGDACRVTDGEGLEAEALIQRFAPDGRALLSIVRKTLESETCAEPRVLVRVFPALLRKGKTDFLVEKAQELGVSELCPIVSEHSEVKIAAEKIEKITERWKRIAREAAKQSGSLKVLHIKPPQPFKESIEKISPEEALVIFHPDSGAISFLDWLPQIRELAKEIKVLNIFIGPEGGFSEEEIVWVKRKRKEKRFWIVELGQVLLKADTAFIGAVAALKFLRVLE